MPPRLGLAASETGTPVLCIAYFLTWFNTSVCAVTERIVTGETAIALLLPCHCQSVLCARVVFTYLTTLICAYVPTCRLGCSTGRPEREEEVGDVGLRPAGAY